MLPRKRFPLVEGKCLLSVHRNKSKGVSGLLGLWIKGGALLRRTALQCVCVCVCVCGCSYNGTCVQQKVYICAQMVWGLTQRESKTALTDRGKTSHIHARVL